MNIDHLAIPVTDIETSKGFYTAALAPLGMRIITETPDSVTYGKSRPEFKIYRSSFPARDMHIGFGAENRQQVDEFHKAALVAGGMDNGKPGIRPQYHKNYYGSFVLDPDEYNIEAVCHAALGD